MIIIILVMSVDGYTACVVLAVSSRLLYSWMDTLCSIHDVLSAVVLMEGYTV